MNGVVFVFLLAGLSSNHNRSILRFFSWFGKRKNWSSLKSVDVQGCFTIYSSQCRRNRYVGLTSSVSKIKVSKIGGGRIYLFFPVLPTFIVRFHYLRDNGRISKMVYYSILTKAQIFYAWIVGNTGFLLRNQ